MATRADFTAPAGARRFNARQARHTLKTFWCHSELEAMGTVIIIGAAHVLAQKRERRACSPVAFRKDDRPSHHTMQFMIMPGIVILQLRVFNGACCTAISLVAYRS